MCNLGRLSYFMVSAFVLISVNAVAAQDRYVHLYKFVPEASQLSVTGGFAGSSHDYGIDGSFRLVIDQRPNQPLLFGFSHVRARLIGDGPLSNQPLNPLLQMSTWQGILRNSFTIDFSGQDGQGAPIDVTGILGNVVLLLDGQNRPPCCDYLNYRLSAMTQIVSLNGQPNLVPAESWMRQAGLDDEWTMESSWGASFVPEPAGTTFVLVCWIVLHVRWRPCS